jgi:SOS response regulatory protein OraA/RecX
VPVKLSDLDAALRYCFLLLKYRKRSEAELRKRLQLRKCPLPVQDKAISRLRDSGLISEDADFAREWAEFKLAGGYGINRICVDLIKRGIARPALENIRAWFKTERQEEARRAIADLITKKTNQRVLDYREKHKLIRFLLQRGFRLEEVLEALPNNH